MSDNKHLMTTYAPLPVSFERGEGSYLWDTDGKRYLDALCGIAVCGLGHAHPEVTKVLTTQGNKLLHTSNLYNIANQQKLANTLCGLSSMDNVFFANSGSEANEAAIKIARLYGHDKGIDTPTIVVMENSFHGRTMATLTATGNDKMQDGFGPLLQGFVRVPYDDINALENIGDSNSSIVAVLVEPVQGESGINIPKPDYLNRVRKLCDKHNWLLMLDEIQTGMGRSGQWFAHQHNKIQPDVMTLAKALGNGLPIGVCLAKGKAASVMKPGKHGSTFGGNPLCCAVASAVVASIEKENLVNHAADLGSFILDTFKQKLSEVKQVIDVRGLGLLIGIELNCECSEIVQLCLDKGVLINVTNSTVVRLLPPLNMTQEQASDVVNIVSDCIQTFAQQAAA